MHTSACRSNIKVGEILQVKYKGKAELAGHVKYKGWPEGIRSNIMVGQSLQVKYKSRLQLAARGGVLFFPVHITISWLSQGKLCLARQDHCNHTAVVVQQ